MREPFQPDFPDGRLDSEVAVSLGIRLRFHDLRRKSAELLTRATSLASCRGVFLGHVGSKKATLMDEIDSRAGLVRAAKRTVGGVGQAFSMPRLPPITKGCRRRI